MKNCINQLNFKAQHLMDTKIRKKKGNEYKDEDISLVVFDKQNYKDKEALENISEKWSNKSYAYNIYYDYSSRFVKHNSYYALTSQKYDYENIKPSKILGLIEVQEENGEPSYIEYIQTNPKYIKTPKKNPEKIKYKGVGAGLINCMKNLYFDTGLELISVKSARGFYEKMGFKPSEENTSVYTWNV